MSYVILQDGPQRASAFSVSLLAGCAGYGTEDEFLDACRGDDRLLSRTARQVDPFMSEAGANGLADKNLRQRLLSLHLDIAESITPRYLSEADKAFEKLLRTGQTNVLAQTLRMDRLRKSMTTTALALATAVAVVLSGAGVTEAHADSSISRFAKDTVGGILGGGILGHFGKGRGKTALTVLGAAAGIATAEAMQHQNDPRYATYPAAQMQSGSQPSAEPLSLDNRNLMNGQEQKMLAARDAYARALYAEQQADVGRVLDPHNKAAYENAVAKKAAAQDPLQNYTQARSDFDNAYVYLTKHGFDVHEFSYAYNLSQQQVTAKDMNLGDMSAIQPVASRPVASANEFQP